jgi:methionine sulfoxide reductase catalytic subunit
MNIVRPRPWQLPERTTTPEGVYRNRRQVLATLGFAGVAAAFGKHAWAQDPAATAVATPAATPAEMPSPAAPPMPPARNPRYIVDRPLTAESLAARHNIFDEFAAERDRVWRVAEGFRTDPWRIHVGGQVKKQLSFDVRELTRRLGLEERVYRHRCVEAWSMAVPWYGFPLAKFVELCEPLGKAKYLRMISVARPEELPGWYATRRVFPYYEALSLAEATHELAFLATGIYGKALPPQHGAPLRLVVPWKYGFKSAKSLVSFQFTAERPGTFWNDLSPDKYSFAANVDPTETHPWPQSHETMLGDSESRPTLPFNGYAELVAGLYA